MARLVNLLNQSTTLVGEERLDTEIAVLKYNGSQLWTWAIDHG
jgi:hypothetical protein